MSGFFGPSCCQALKSAHRVANRSFDHREGAMPGIAGKGRLDPTSRDQRTIKFGGLTAPPVAEPQAGTDGTGHGGVPCAARWISIRFSGSEVRHVDLSSASPTCANAPTLWHACPPMNRSKPRGVYVDHRTERAHGLRDVAMADGALTVKRFRRRGDGRLLRRSMHSSCPGRPA